MAKVKKKGIKSKKKKDLKQIGARGNAYIYSSYNNTLVTLTDPNGNVICWSSAGKMGFKGPKKATAYAAQVLVKDVVAKAMEKGLREVAVYAKGIGSGREAALRALNANGLGIISIKDVTPIPHNGCRAKKPRRV